MSKPTTSTPDGQAASADLKQCVSCFELKPLSEFRRRSGRRAGANARRGICRQCRAALLPAESGGADRDDTPAVAAQPADAGLPAGGFADGPAPGGKRGRRRRGLPAAAPEAALDEAAALTAAPEEAPRPARKRRRRRGGQPAPEATQPEPAAALAAPEAPAAPLAEAGAPKRKRRGRRSRGAAAGAAAQGAAVAASPAQQQPAAAEPPQAEAPAAPLASPGAPKRKRRGRRKRRGAAAGAAAAPQAREAAALPAAPAPSARQAAPQPLPAAAAVVAARPPQPAPRPAAMAGEPAARPQARGSARARQAAPGGAARGIDPHDASLLQATREGYVRMRGRTDKGRGWYQEIDLEMAVTLVRERAAVVVNRHTIRRLLSNRDFRMMILNRDKYTCYFCGEYGDTIDHLLPRSKGGHTTPDNCVCACNLCNQTKANRDLDEFVAAGIPVKPLEE